MEIKPLSVTSFADVFSHSCLFVFYGFLCHAKVFPICFFISSALGDEPKKTLVQFMSENVLSVISSRRFILNSAVLSIFLCMVCGCVLTSLIYI